MANQNNVLVLGLGNDLLSDDGIGLRVASVLATRLAGHPEITVAETAEMGLALLDHITGFEALVIVDAIQTGQAAPGFVHEIDSAELKSLPALAPHFVGVNEALALGRSLGIPVPRETKIFAVEVADPFTVKSELTPSLDSALPAITERIETAVLSWCAGGRSRNRS